MAFCGRQHVIYTPQNTGGTLYFPDIFSSLSYSLVFLPFCSWGQLPSELYYQLIMILLTWWDSMMRRNVSWRMPAHVFHEQAGFAFLTR